MTDLLTDYLWDNNLLGFFSAFYSEQLGEGFFWGFIFYIVLSIFHLRYENMGATIVILLLLTGGLHFLVPINAYRIVGIVLALGIGGILTYLFTRRR